MSKTAFLINIRTRTLSWIPATWLCTIYYTTYFENILGKCFCSDSVHVSREQAINRSAVRHNWISTLFGQGRFLSPHPAKTQLLLSLTVHTPDLLYLNDKFIIFKVNTISGTYWTIQKFGVCKIYLLFFWGERSAKLLCSPRHYLIKNTIRQQYWEIQKKRKKKVFFSSHYLVFSVAWSFWNHSNMLIYYQC